jgi:hypothetical protein
LIVSYTNTFSIRSGKVWLDKLAVRLVPEPVTQTSDGADGPFVDVPDYDNPAPGPKGVAGLEIHEGLVWMSKVDVDGGRLDGSVTPAEFGMTGLKIAAASVGATKPTVRGVFAEGADNELLRFLEEFILFSPHDRVAYLRVIYAFDIAVKCLLNSSKLNLATLNCHSSASLLWLAALTCFSLK